MLNKNDLNNIFKIIQNQNLVSAKFIMNQFDYQQIIGYGFGKEQEYRIYF